MYTVKCDICWKKYTIADISKINLHAKYRCKNCGEVFSIADQLPENGKSEFHYVDDTHDDSKFYPVVNKNDSTKKNIQNSIQKEISWNNEKKRRYTLRVKFNLALICIMILSVTVIFFISDYILQKRAEKQIVSNARFLLTTIEASRAFTGKVIKPALYKALPGRFIVEGMSSSFGARSLFEGIKKKYPEYYFKHASLNPRNPINLADKFEAEIIEKEFKHNPDEKEWQGYRDFNGKRDFIIMKPVIAEERCMRCHSDPEKAPVELLERYGSKAGFGMVVGDVIGALSISVPAKNILAKARNISVVFNISVILFFKIYI